MSLQQIISKKIAGLGDFTPTAIRLYQGQPVVTWCGLDGVAFDRLFFRDSIDAAATRGGRPPTQTPFVALLQEAPPRRPGACWPSSRARLTGFRITTAGSRDADTTLRSPLPTRGKARPRASALPIFAINPLTR